MAVGKHNHRTRSAITRAHSETMVQMPTPMRPKRVLTP